MIVIHRVGRKDPVVDFAARELARYLRLMGVGDIALQPAKAYRADTPGIWLGTGQALGAPLTSLHELAASSRNDAVLIQANGRHVALSGPNPRSVLFAVYRYLEELGCRWLRPGRDGERIPRRSRLRSQRLDILEVPSARHRCICIEGSCSTGHVRDMIDYAAKRGFNAYFIQFRNAFTFFDRWYAVERNRGHRRTPFSSAQADAATAKVKREAHRRGLMLHAVGHGWTCEPLGIAGEEWAPTTAPVPKEARKHFALVDGKRELCGGIALNTQLCYSSPKVRRLMTDAVAAYAAEHPKEEIIHVWLADGANNFCECASCRPHRPSDLYVRILNDIDAALTARGLATRIVFLAYVDLLWAPQRETIANPDRFILMFAPITRSYRLSFADKRQGKPERVAPYQRNRMKFPASPETNLKLLAGWKRAFTGECVDFDYHLWNAHHFDPGQMRLARVLHKDAASLRQLGMDGFISCQIQRVAFPTGLYLEVMGRALWDRTTTFDAVVGGYMTDVFGRSGSAVRRYLETLSRLMDHDDGGQWEKVAPTVAAFRPRMRRGCRLADPVTAAAWKILDQHAWYVVACADLYGLIERGDPSATERYRQFADEVDRRRPDVHHVFDTRAAKLTIQDAMAARELPFEERVYIPRTT